MDARYATVSLIALPVTPAGLGLAVGDTYQSGVTWGGATWILTQASLDSRGVRWYVPLPMLSHGATYTTAVEVANPGQGSVTARMDWCDIGLSSITLAAGARGILRLSSARAEYTTSYRGRRVANDRPSHHATSPVISVITSGPPPSLHRLGGGPSAFSAARSVAIREIIDDWLGQQPA